MTTPPIPEKLTKAILFLRGKKDGTRWLADLPPTIEHYQRAWDLRLDVISDGGAMSACALGTRVDGAPVVLKVPVDVASGRLEGELLDYWGPTGAVPAVLDRDPETGVMVMERIQPGHTPWPRGGVADSDQYSDLITRLNAANPNTPPPLKPMDEVIEMRLDWARERFENPNYRNPKADLTTAREVFEALRATFDVETARVLHADLQAKNVLADDQAYFAIDPMGAVGDLNAEVALWIAIQDGATSIAARIKELSTHPLLVPARLTAWTYVLAVAEYRQYLRPSGDRIEKYLEDARPVELAHALG